MFGSQRRAGVILVHRVIRLSCLPSSGLSLDRGWLEPGDVVLSSFQPTPRSVSLEDLIRQTRGWASDLYTSVEQLLPANGLDCCDLETSVSGVHPCQDKVQ